jgi:predicted amidohydrolase
MLIQHTSGTDPQANRAQIPPTVHAALDGSGPVDLIVLPEASQVDFGSGATPLGPLAEPLDGPFGQMLSALAADCGAVVVGGMFEATDGARPFNTLAAFGPDGTLLASYRKVHLYDAFGYRESDRLRAGEPAAVTVVVPVAGSEPITVGLQTCYDLRFPEQSRALVDAGADLLVIPAAWLRGPGKEHHWCTLLAARAIENTVHVAAAAKAGERYCGLSRVVDPMGEVLAGLGDVDGATTGRVDPARTAQVRRVNASLANRRWHVVPGQR